MKLLDGKHREELVLRVGDLQDTEYWPQTLSETLETALRKQAIQTLDEVVRLVIYEGAGLQRIMAEKQALLDSLQDSLGKAELLDINNSGRSAIQNL